MNRFLTPEFLSLFIFDGEFAGRLLDGEYAEADRVVDALCQLYLLDDISSFAQEYWELSAKAHTTKTSTGLSRLLRLRDAVAARRRQILQAYADAKRNASKLNNEVKSLERKIEARINSVEVTRKRHQEARIALSSAQGEVKVGSTSLMSALRLPHATHPTISRQLQNLRDNLDRLRLPENTSAQFFKELVAEDECICGRPMDAASAHEIRERAKRYLDADDAGLINALKRDIEQFADDDDDPNSDMGYTRVKRLSEDLTRAVRTEKEAAQQVRALARQLIDAGDEELANWQNDHQAKTTDLETLADLIASIEGPGTAGEPDDLVMSLSLITKRLAEKNDQIAKIRGTVKLRKQTQLIETLLDSAAKHARDRIKQELLHECNSRLGTILANDPLRIERIDRAIRLENQDGASAGQTLSIGYTFLMSVLNRGQNDFPLVVDSPAGPMDEGVRRRIGQLLPSLCTQFIGFTINTERIGFVDALEAQVDDIAFLTLFRKTPGTRHMMKGLPPGKYTESKNAVLVDDRDYFYQFDVIDDADEEPDGAISTS